jgi:hypothetical protein
LHINGGFIFTGRPGDSEERGGGSDGCELYKKRKTRAAQVAATNAEFCAPQKNEKTSVVFEAKVLGGDGVEVQATFVTITATVLLMSAQRGLGD